MTHFNRQERLELDTFLETYPKIRRLLQFIREHPDEEHTIDSVVTQSGLRITFLDLKSLFVHKVLSAVDADGAPVRLAWDLQDSCRYQLNPAKVPLVEAVLEQREQPEIQAGWKVRVAGGSFSADDV